jgi:hypothetical protein
VTNKRGVGKYGPINLKWIDIFRLPASLALINAGDFFKVKSEFDNGTEPTNSPNHIEFVFFFVR